MAVAVLLAGWGRRRQPTLQSSGADMVVVDFVQHLHGQSSYMVALL